MFGTWVALPLFIRRVFLLCPPAALCCQVEPEGLALITRKRFSVTLMKALSVPSPRPGPSRALIPPCCLFLEQWRPELTICCSCPPNSLGIGDEKLCVCLWVKTALCPPLLIYLHWAVVPLGPWGKWGTPIHSYTQLKCVATFFLTSMKSCKLKCTFVWCLIYKMLLLLTKKAV